MERPDPTVINAHEILEVVRAARREGADVLKNNFAVVLKNIFAVVFGLDDEDVLEEVLIARVVHLGAPARAEAAPLLFEVEAIESFISFFAMSGSLARKDKCWRNVRVESLRPFLQHGNHTKRHPNQVETRRIRKAPVIHRWLEGRGGLAYHPP